MKIVASAGLLGNALALATSLADDKCKKIVALDAVKLTAADGAVAITANVFDHALKLSVPATVEVAGELALPGERLAKLTACFPADEALSIRADGAVAHVTASGSRFKLPVIATGLLPPMPVLNNESGHVELARGEMLMLLRVGFAIPSDKTKPYLGGSLLHATADGLAAVATDGYRLARIVIPGAGSNLSPDRTLVLPAASLDIIGKLLRDKSIERVGLRRSRTLVEVATKKATFTSRLVDQIFPDYTKLIPAASGNSVAVERGELAQALSRALAVVEPKQQRVVGLSWSADAAELRLCLRDSDAADDIVAAEASGSGRTAMQIPMLAAIVEAFAGKRIRLDCRDGKSPLLVTDGDADLTALLMPCQWPAAQTA